MFRFGFFSTLIASLLLLSVPVLSQEQVSSQDSGLSEKCKSSLTEQEQEKLDDLSPEKREEWLKEKCSMEDSAGEIPEPTTNKTVKLETVAVENAGEKLQRTGEEEKKKPVLTILELDNPSGMNESDVDYLTQFVRSTVENYPEKSFELKVSKRFASGDCDLGCQVSRTREDGASWVLTGSLRKFLDGYIVELSFYSTATKEVMATSNTNGAASSDTILNETRAAVEELLDTLYMRENPGKPAPSSRSDVDKPVVEPLSPAGVVAIQESELKMKNALDPHPSRVYAKTRAVAHVFFWLGLDCTLGGILFASSGGGETGGLVLISVGGLFVFIGSTCGLAYASKVSKWNQRNRGLALVTPIITPDMAGLGLSKTF